MHLVSVGQDRAPAARAVVVRELGLGARAALLGLDIGLHLLDDVALFRRQPADALGLADLRHRAANSCRTRPCSALPGAACRRRRARRHPPARSARCRSPPRRRHREGRPRPWYGARCGNLGQSFQEPRLQARGLRPNMRTACSLFAAITPHIIEYCAVSENPILVMPIRCASASTIATLSYFASLSGLRWISACSGSSFCGLREEIGIHRGAVDRRAVPGDRAVEIDAQIDRRRSAAAAARSSAAAACPASPHGSGSAV